MITANKYFSHWIKKIDIKRYGDDLQILPVGNSTDVYQYSNIKAYFHVKLHAKRCVFLYAKEGVALSNGRNLQTESNLEAKINKFT